MTFRRITLPSPSVVPSRSIGPVALTATPDRGFPWRSVTATVSDGRPALCEGAGVRGLGVGVGVGAGAGVCAAGLAAAGAGAVCGGFSAGACAIARLATRTAVVSILLSQAGGGRRVKLIGCWGARCQGARVLGAGVPGCQGARVPRCQGAKVPGCRGAGCQGCQGAGVPRCQGAGVPGARVPTCEGARVLSWAAAAILATTGW